MEILLTMIAMQLGYAKGMPAPMDHGYELLDWRLPSFAEFLSDLTQVYSSKSEGDKLVSSFSKQPTAI